jgi:hypothetical protein
MSETNEHLQADGSSEDKPRRGHNNPPDAVSEYAAARDEAKRYLLGLIRDEIKQDTSKIGWLERAYRMYLPVERDNTARALFEDDLKGFRIKPTKGWGKFQAYLRLVSKQVEQEAKELLASGNKEQQSCGVEELEARIKPRSITQDFNRLGRALTVADIIICSRNDETTPEVYQEGLVSEVIQFSQEVKLLGIASFKCGSIKAASDALAIINKSRPVTEDSASDEGERQQNGGEVRENEGERIKGSVWYPKTYDVLDRALKLVADGETASIRITLDSDGRIVVYKERRDNGYAAIAHLKAGLNEEAQVDDETLFPIEAGERNQADQDEVG